LESVFGGAGKADIVAGRIFGVHGVHGALKVLSAGGDGSNFEHYHELWVGPENGGDGRWLRVESVSASGAKAVIKLEGVDDRLQAESLKGSVLKIGREQCRKLPKGSYFVFDLIGLQVKTTENRIVGTVRDVLNPSSQSVLVVDSEGREILVPAVKTFIKEVDLETRTLILDPVEGMLDGNAD
jgi:16S rRNA processing protein RimM